jgi:RNA-directed DNA polymerase
METWSVHQLYKEAKINLGEETASALQEYALNLMNSGFPVIFSLGHLSKITSSDYGYLRNTINRNQEIVNYKMFPITKRSGHRRFIHAVSEKLSVIHTFINHEILQHATSHPCSYAFHKSGGIHKCALMHCGAKWLFQYDLTDFFYHISEVDVYHIFQKIGYGNLLSFEMARLCTTIRLPKLLNSYLHKPKHCDDTDFPYKKTYNIGVLPQGASTSPMLSNLAAETLDIELSAFAFKHGLVYTRYADDLTFSTIDLPHNISIGDIHRQIVGIIRHSNFKENKQKIRIAGPGSKKVVLGLLVDGETPRLSKEMYHRIERHLHAALKYGITDTALHEGFDSAFGFYNHLSGLISYVHDVDKQRWSEFNKQLSILQLPWENN